MPGWNFADVWEAVAETQPDAPALAHGDDRVTWGEFDARSSGVAKWLLDLGAERQDKVAHYLYNSNEFLESMFAIFRAGLAPVNTNYRYADDELLYLWDNADAVAVVFHGTFANRIEALRSRLPKVKGWLWVDDGDGLCPDWATPYQEAAAKGSPGERTQARWGRDGDDLYMLYTGGTTGMPKGVMWRQDDIFMSLNESNGSPFPAEPDLDAVRTMRAQQGPGLRSVPACPLMHGTGAFTSFSILSGGGCVVTLTNRNFDPEELLATIDREKINAVAIVGDAFAKPILRALDAIEAASEAERALRAETETSRPGKYDLSSLMAIISSGVMWSHETKQGLLRHHPAMLLSDAFSSSEALGMGSSVSGGGNAAETAKFALGQNAIVITEDGRVVEPGSGEIGMVGVRGRTPLGYYKDPEKSAKTFREINGVRYSIPGDYATVEPDGSLKLLGRGSVCINTGGEKVYPEEVEEVLKTHPAIRDAVAVGVPDEKWGEAITAVVELHPEASFDEPGVIAHVKARLAAYKAPKRVLVVDTIGRAPNGKVDYKRIRAEAAARTP